jgi:pimeloyl-ACP methyl ester carboxylesterase
MKKYIHLIVIPLVLSACNGTQQSDSLFASEERREVYFRRYDEIVRVWKAETEDVYVNTSLGLTHVIRHPNPDRAALILFHAAGVSAASWYANFDALSGRFQVFALDTPGDAGKSVLNPVDLTVEAYNTWILELLDFFDLPSANLCGHSIGGFIAANFAKSYPDKVEKLILLAPAATFQDFRWYVKLGLMMEGKPGTGPKAETILRMQAGKSFDPDPRFVNLMEAVRDYCSVRMIFPYKLKDDELMRITAPTLVLFPGQEVIYSPVTAAQRARKLLKYGTIEMVPDAGHTIIMERSHIVNKRIVDFVYSE